MGEFLSFMSESWVLMSELLASMSEFSVFTGEFKMQQSFRNETIKIETYRFFTRL
jgi:hypothetical protein